MKYAHCIKDLFKIYDRIRSARIEDSQKVLADVLECAKMSGMIHYHGWNTFYHRWDVGMMASKPLRSYLKYLIHLHKSYPEGSASRWHTCRNRRMGWGDKIKY